MFRQNVLPFVSGSFYPINSLLAFGFLFLKMHLISRVRGREGEKEGRREGEREQESERASERERE